MRGEDRLAEYDGWTGSTVTGLGEAGLGRCGTEQSGIRIPGDCKLCFEAKVGIRV